MCHCLRCSTQPFTRPLTPERILTRPGPGFLPFQPSGLTVCRHGNERRPRPREKSVPPDASRRRSFSTPKTRIEAHHGDASPGGGVMNASAHGQPPHCRGQSDPRAPARSRHRLPKEHQQGASDDPGARRRCGRRRASIVGSGCSWRRRTGGGGGQHLLGRSDRADVKFGQVRRCLARDSLGTMPSRLRVGCMRGISVVALLGSEKGT